MAMLLLLLAVITVMFTAFSDHIDQLLWHLINQLLLGDLGLFFRFIVIKLVTGFIFLCRELYSNNISGTIPSELGNLTNLVSLDLYLNNFTGPIPASLGNLLKLRFL